MTCMTCRFDDFGEVCSRAVVTVDCRQSVSFVLKSLENREPIVNRLVIPFSALVRKTS